MCKKQKQIWKKLTEVTWFNNANFNAKWLQFSTEIQRSLNSIKYIFKVDRSVSE